jgi:predicted nucleic acid-binding Zn ribbon protein
LSHPILLFLHQVEPFGVDVAHRYSQSDQRPFHRVHHRLRAADEDEAGRVVVPVGGERAVRTVQVRARQGAPVRSAA